MILSSHMQPVTNSSHIEESAYDPEEKILRVKFNSGKSYDYHGVTASQNASFHAAASAGEYLHNIIKPGCPASKV